MLLDTNLITKQRRNIMKKLLTMLLSITLSYSSFASLGPDAEVPYLEFGASLQVDDKLSNELKEVQGPVFLYSEQTDEYFKFEQETGIAFKSSKEEYQVAFITLPALLLLGVVSMGVVLTVPPPAFLFTPYGDHTNFCETGNYDCWCYGLCFGRQF